MKNRLAQVESELSEKIAVIVQREVRDPRVGIATITGVKISADLQKALVFVSVMGAEEEQEQTLKSLQAAAGFIQHHLGKAIHLRRTPHLTFQLDHTAEQAIEISRKIDAALGPGHE